jgi:NTP pyrophosphatase (non-canonical NTP hydrolase)
LSDGTKVDYADVLQEIAAGIWTISHDKGFHDRFTTVSFTSQDGIDALSTSLMLITGELVEAQNELRDGHRYDEIYFKGTKPEGFGVELADAVIRILDLALVCGLDIGDLITAKMAYNAGRPFMHGGKGF